MTEEEMKEELRLLLEETTVHLGGTSQTYIRFLTMLNEAGKLERPRALLYGQMVFFHYKPEIERGRGKLSRSKNKYYDRFPLVFVTETYRNSFEGINLHFLSPEHRKMLFSTLMDNLPTIEMGEEWRKRLRVNYERLKSRVIFRFYRPCYRRYLWKNIIRRPVLVPFELWDDMVDSNTMRIVNANPIKVYRDSFRKAIRTTR